MLGLEGQRGQGVGGRSGCRGQAVRGHLVKSGLATDEVLVLAGHVQSSQRCVQVVQLLRCHRHQTCEGNDDDVQSSCAHQHPERSHDAY